MSVIDNSLLLTAPAGGGYQVSRSLRFEAGDSSNLSRTPSTASNRRTWTWSSWVKGPFNAASYPRILNVEGPSSGYRTVVRFTDTSQLQAYSYDGSNFEWILTTTQLFRDPSAWYHLLIAFDTTQATSSNRVKIYVNGVQVTAFATATYPSLNFEAAVNHTSAHTIGGGQPLSAYLAEIFLIDGQQLDPSSFTTTDLTTGQLVPKAYTGSYGTNGFKLNFSDNSTTAALGTDSSGAGNTWSVNNLSVTAGSGNDSLVDTPTSGSTADTGLGGQVTGNYATFNPIANPGGSTLTNGNLDLSGTASGSWRSQPSTVGISSGKFYWETTINSTPGGGLAVGIASTDTNVAGFFFPGYAGATTYGYLDTGTKWNNGSQTSYGASFTLNDVVGISLDMSTGALVFYKNGTSQGTAFTVDTTKTYIPHVGYSNTQSCAINFGQRAFAYTAPSGFKALVDTNLPTPVVAKPSTAMDVKLYTGNGSTQTISGLGFSPDLVWLKPRSEASSNVLFDAIRGTNLALYSNLTNAETTESTSLTAFNSDGFALGANNNVNKSSITYVGWTWDAGTSTVTNTAGSISSQVRANASAGFSVVTYTGDRTSAGNSTIGHGLGVAPALVITKSRSDVTGWIVQHSSLGTDDYLVLNSTNAAADSVAVGAGALPKPTSTVFYASWLSGLNESGQTFVAYCFAPVSGYSNAFSYAGNGSSDGPMVWLGFKPRLIIYKRTDSTSNWSMYDTARDTYNITDRVLAPNSSAAEAQYASDIVDVLSNGFKIRSTGAAQNASGGTYIGFAFAESPFAYSRAR